MSSDLPALTTQDFLKQPMEIPKNTKPENAEILLADESEEDSTINNQKSKIDRPNFDNQIQLVKDQ